MTMVWAAFTSEWTKLKRKTLFLSTFLGLAAAASLFVVLMFSQATNNGGIVTLHQLARPNGLVIGVARASMLLGVITFLVAALCFAAVIALIVAVLAAQSRGVSTHAWFTGTGLSDMFQELGDLALATVGYSVLGMAVGQFVRSAVFAVIIGFAWLIAVENIIVRIVPSVQQWMPGTSLVAVASAGNEGVGYAHGLFLGAVYVIAAIAASMIVFLRSDVTA